jgi:hypothetical protein
MIVGNDHLLDYQTKIANSTGDNSTSDNVCLRLIETIDSITNIENASFQVLIDNVFIPLVQVTPIVSSEDNFGGRNKRYKTKRYKTKR